MGEERPCDGVMDSVAGVALCCVGPQYVHAKGPPVCLHGGRRRGVGTMQISEDKFSTEGAEELHFCCLQHVVHCIRAVRYYFLYTHLQLRFIVVFGLMTEFPSCPGFIYCIFLTHQVVVMLVTSSSGIPTTVVRRHTIG